MPESLLPVSPELSLVVLRPQEAGALFSLIHRNREHLREWLPWLDGTRTPADTRRFLELSYAGFQRGEGFSYGLRFEGRLAGVIGFHGFDPLHRVTSIGYWLSADQCGKGLMRQAVRACLGYAFEKRGMNRLTIRCATGNARSRAIPESLGFTHEGTQRQAEWLYDHFVDLEVFSLLAAEWRRSVFGLL